MCVWVEIASRKQVEGLINFSVQNRNICHITWPICISANVYAECFSLI